MNLVPAIRAIEREVRDIWARHVKELKPYADSLEQMRKINTACERCEGTGKTFRRECAEDEGKHVKCSVCHGTGRSDEK